MKDKTLILLRGLPGSGKTTFAEMLCGLVFHHVRCFSADDYFDNNNIGFVPSLLGMAHADCQARVREHFATSEFCGIPTAIVHNTSTTEDEVEVYRKIAEEFDANFISLIVENRHGNTSVHHVPDLTMERMKKRFSVKL